MKSLATPKRVRIEIESRASYRIMWLAGVRQLDLTQHCLKVFAECDRHNVNPKRRTQTLHLPAENPPAAWYLCALPIPWDWARNAHLAFEYSPGATWEATPRGRPARTARQCGACHRMGRAQHSAGGAPPVVVPVPHLPELAVRLVAPHTPRRAGRSTPAAQGSDR